MTHQDFYKKVIERYFDIDSKKTDFILVKDQSDLSEILDLENELREWNKSEDDVLEYIEKYIQHSVKTDHPQFLNRMWTGANPAWIAWEMIASLMQTSACTYESAPVSTLMEKYMISQMLEIVGFELWEWQMTTGSSNANMIAMMTARNLHTTQVKKAGLFWSPELFAFVNTQSHYSLDKAANILWIWSDHLIKVPVNKAWEMDLLALEELLQTYAKLGKNFFVAATAGTTVRGAYDNISGLLKLRKKYDFWLHVDGAWGGPVFLSEKLREIYLKDIEQVDSFTFDFHKMPGVALICNMLLINNKKWALEYNCNTWNTDYIFKGEEESLDLWMNSLQCWRRVDSLKLFLDWKYYGQKWFAEKIEKYLDLCAYAESYILNHPKLEMTFERSSFNVCFCYKVPWIQESNRVNSLIRKNLYTRWLSLVGSATIDSIFFLRLLICNDDIHKKNIDIFFENVIMLWDEEIQK